MQDNKGIEEFINDCVSIVNEVYRLSIIKGFEDVNPHNVQDARDALIYMIWNGTGENAQTVCNLLNIKQRSSVNRDITKFKKKAEAKIYRDVRIYKIVEFRKRVQESGLE